MSELVHFETVELPEVLAVGRLVVADMNGLMPDKRTLGDLWGECLGNGMFARLEALKDFVHDPAYVGYMDCFDFSKGLFRYLCGMLMKPGVPVPEGFVAVPIPAAKVAVSWVKGQKEKVTEICRDAYSLTENKVVENNMKFAGGWCMEVYTARFDAPDANGDIIVDYWMPCV